MVDDTYTFEDPYVGEVKIQKLGSEYEFQVRGYDDVTMVFSEDDVVGFYRWLGRNVGALGEGWKSIIESDNKWPKHMDKNDLHELAEIQQKIIQKLKQKASSMDEEAKDILRDIRDSLQNIEDRATSSFDQVEAFSSSTVPVDAAEEAHPAEELKEAVSDKDLKDAIEASYDSLQKLRNRWFETVKSSCELSPNEMAQLDSDLEEAESPMDVAYTAHEHIRRYEAEGGWDEDELRDDEYFPDDTFEEAMNQIKDD